MAKKKTLIVNIVFYIIGIFIVYSVVNAIITLIKDFPESLGAILFIAIFAMIFYVSMKFFESKYK